MNYESGAVEMLKCVFRVIGKTTEDISYLRIIQEHSDTDIFLENPTNESISKLNFNYSSLKDDIYGFVCFKNDEWMCHSVKEDAILWDYYSCPTKEELQSMTKKEIMLWGYES